MIVKNRDGRPKPSLITRVERREFSTARSASTRDGWGLPSPTFLDCLGRAVLA